MQLKIHKIIPVTLFLACWMAQSSLKAQYVLSSTTTNPYSSGTGYDLEFQTMISGTNYGGNLIAKGNFGTGSLLGVVDTGVGARMVWYPGRAAFRVGEVDSATTFTLDSSITAGTEWDNSHMAGHSVAFGFDTVANETFSTAFGSLTYAAGTYSIAGGFTTSASGTGSVALGYLTIASGNQSFAGGFTTHATGIGSTAFGYLSVATNSYATAEGYLAQATSYGSTALGYTPIASGQYSTALGYGTLADTCGSTALGCFNVAHASGSGTDWVLGDPLFAIGNGTSATARSDAMLVLKNGNTTINGTDNEMPNQTLTGAVNSSNSVLTKGIADSRYLQIGGGTSATSFVLFAGATATGTNSVAVGNTKAQAYADVAMGQYNVGGYTTGGNTTWNPTDPLFELGNGTDDTHRKDALLVDKSGNGTFQGNIVAGGTISAGGVITAAPGGDIPVYAGN